jgi:hypothetical protein
MIFFQARFLAGGGEVPGAVLMVRKNVADVQSSFQ